MTKRTRAQHLFDGTSLTAGGLVLIMFVVGPVVALLGFLGK